MSLTQEILQSIRFVKYFGWETYFSQRLKPIRASESQSLQWMHLLRCVIGAIAQSLPVFANMVTFIVSSSTSHNLTAAVVFSSLAMLTSLRTPTSWLPVTINLVADAIQSLKRIEVFLLAEEVPSNTLPDASLSSAIQIVKASFTWENILKQEDKIKYTEIERKFAVKNALTERFGKHSLTERNRIDAASNTLKLMLPR